MAFSLEHTPSVILDVQSIKLKTPLGCKGSTVGRENPSGNTACQEGGRPNRSPEAAASWLGSTAQGAEVPASVPRACTQYSQTA